MSASVATWEMKLSVRCLTSTACAWLGVPELADRGSRHVANGKLRPVGVPWTRPPIFLTFEAVRLRLIALADTSDRESERGSLFTVDTP